MKKQKFLASILAMTMVFSMGISANAKAGNLELGNGLADGLIEFVLY